MRRSRLVAQFSTELMQLGDENGSQGDSYEEGSKWTDHRALQPGGKVVAAAKRGRRQRHPVEPDKLLRRRGASAQIRARDLWRITPNHLRFDEQEQPGSIARRLTPECA